jgi:hypothetical protein
MAAVFVKSTGKLAWRSQSNRRHGHFGLKSAPRHRDFRPEMEGDSN